jgi:recombinational DNA repair protein (RecF pathway)
VTQVKEPDERLFELLKNWLTFVEKKPEFHWILIDALVVHLFVRLGLTPIIDQCVVCNKLFSTIALEEIDNKKRGGEYRPGFFFAGGGLICAPCRREKQDTDQEIHNAGLKEISTMSVLLKTDWALVYDYPLEQKEEQALHALVYKFAVYHTERKISDWWKIRTMVS